MLLLNFYSKIHAKLCVKCNASNCHACTSFGHSRKQVPGTRDPKNQDPQRPEPQKPGPQELGLLKPGLLNQIFENECFITFFYYI